MPLAAISQIKKTGANPEGFITGPALEALSAI
jgi:hypothetical protein